MSAKWRQKTLRWFSGVLHLLDRVRRDLSPWKAWPKCCPGFRAMEEASRTIMVPSSRGRNCGIMSCHPHSPARSLARSFQHRLGTCLGAQGRGLDTSGRIPQNGETMLPTRNEQVMYVLVCSGVCRYVLVCACLCWYVQACYVTGLSSLP